MQSLKTSDKREAQRRSHLVSVEFDKLCMNARYVEKTPPHPPSLSAGDERTNEEVLAQVPILFRKVILRVIEEQRRNPRGWIDTIRMWQNFYTSALTAPMPRPGPSTAIEAQACLNGIQWVLDGKPLPDTQVSGVPPGVALGANGPWELLVKNALLQYQHEVSEPRFKLAERVLKQVQVQDTSIQNIQEALRTHSHERLKEVQPRTVKSQLDAAVSALRLVLPSIKAPTIRELAGVMQPRVGDRQSMPVSTIQRALAALAVRPKAAKIRAGYDGGASQFDLIAVRSLALLGLRPRELLGATASALVEKRDVFGNTGVFFRVCQGKNKASERDIPLTDGDREILDLTMLRAMLDWQERHSRKVAGLVSSLGTRFKKASGGSLYQMRHTWKEIALHHNVDYEIREGILGHAIEGVAKAYGSGIPLKQGLDALMLVRGVIDGDKRDRLRGQA